MKVVASYVVVKVVYVDRERAFLGEFECVVLCLMYNVKVCVEYVKK